MRYQDYAARLHQEQRAIEEQGERERPQRAARRALLEEGSRRYGFGPAREVVVWSSVVDGVTVTIQDHAGGTTSAILAQMIQAVCHVEAWVAGLVDELAPSGPWPPPGAGTLGQVLAAAHAAIPADQIAALEARIGIAPAFGAARADLIAEVRAYIADGNDPAGGDLADLLERHLKAWGAP